MLQNINYKNIFNWESKNKKLKKSKKSRYNNYQKIKNNIKC